MSERTLLKVCVSVLNSKFFPLHNPHERQVVFVNPKMSPFFLGFYIYIWKELGSCTVFKGSPVIYKQVLTVRVDFKSCLSVRGLREGERPKFPIPSNGDQSFCKTGGVQIGRKWAQRGSKFLIRFSCVSLSSILRL